MSHNPRIDEATDGRPERLLELDDDERINSHDEVSVGEDQEKKNDKKNLALKKGDIQHLHYH